MVEEQVEDAGYYAVKYDNLHAMEPMFRCARLGMVERARAMLEAWQSQAAAGHVELPSPPHPLRLPDHSSGVETPSYTLHRWGNADDLAHLRARHFEREWQEYLEDAQRARAEFFPMNDRVGETPWRMRPFFVSTLLQVRELIWRGLTGLMGSLVPYTLQLQAFGPLVELGADVDTGLLHIVNNPVDLDDMIEEYKEEADARLDTPIPPPRDVLEDDDDEEKARVQQEYRMIRFTVTNRRPHLAYWPQMPCTPTYSHHVAGGSPRTGRSRSRTRVALPLVLRHHSVVEDSDFVSLEVRRTSGRGNGQSLILQLAAGSDILDVKFLLRWHFRVRLDRIALFPAPDATNELFDEHVVEGRDGTIYLSFLTNRRLGDADFVSGGSPKVTAGCPGNHQASGSELARDGIATDTGRRSRSRSRGSGSIASIASTTSSSCYSAPVVDLYQVEPAGWGYSKLVVTVDGHTDLEFQVHSHTSAQRLRHLIQGCFGQMIGQPFVYQNEARESLAFLPSYAEVSAYEHLHVRTLANDPSCWFEERIRQCHGTVLSVDDFIPLQLFDSVDDMLADNTQSEIAITELLVLFSRLGTEHISCGGSCIPFCFHLTHRTRARRVRSAVAEYFAVHPDVVQLFTFAPVCRVPDDEEIHTVSSLIGTSAEVEGGLSGSHYGCSVLWPHQPLSDIDIVIGGSPKKRPFPLANAVAQSSGHSGGAAKQWRVGARALALLP
eukprot:3941427-Amphidinium_carterae.1